MSTSVCKQCLTITGCVSVGETGILSWLLGTLFYLYCENLHV